MPVEPFSNVPSSSEPRSGESTSRESFSGEPWSGEPASEASSPEVRRRLWDALLMPPDDLLKQCRRETYQGSGAGGQKRNRVRSGVRLLHDVTGMRAENCEHREAMRNVEAATRGLRLAMALRLGEMGNAIAPQLTTKETNAAPVADLHGSMNIDKETTRLGLNENQATSHRMRFRIESNPNHPDFAPTAALALSTLARHQGRLAETARDLGVTGSALTRHFKAEKSLWAAVLRLREREGRSVLK